MKKIVVIMAVVLCALMLTPCPSSAVAPDCPLWLGTWEVKYDDNSVRIWKIYESTNDTGSSVVLCKAFGASEKLDGTEQKYFQILYIDPVKTYSYTEEEELVMGMDSTEVDVSTSVDNVTTFVARPGGQYPVASGKRTSSVVPEKPLFTTTTTTSVPGPDKKCPIAKVLADDEDDVESLRAFRDSTLAQSAIGRKAIQIYYDNADSINAALERSPALRKFVKRALETIAPMLGRKED